MATDPNDLAIAHTGWHMHADPLHGPVVAELQIQRRAVDGLFKSKGDFVLDVAARPVRPNTAARTATAFSAEDLLENPVAKRRFARAAAAQIEDVGEV